MEANRSGTAEHDVLLDPQGARAGASDQGDASQSKGRLDRARQRRWGGLAAAACAGLGALGLVALAARKVSSPSATVALDSSGSPGFTQLEASLHEAGHDLVADMDFEYTDLAGIGHVDHIASAEHCCTVCKQEPTCKAFTWVVDAHLPNEGGSSGQCWLKSGSFVTASIKRGVFSAYVRDDEVHAKSAAQKVQYQKQVLADLTVTSTTLSSTETHTTTTSTRTSTTATTTKDPCAKRGEGCLDKKCCSDPGFQCNTKNPYWAECMETCMPGPSPLDQVSDDPWECKAIGKRTPGKVRECGTEGENCLEVKCCKTPGMQCFGKNDTFASCRSSCDFASSWTCIKLGHKELGAAPWVAKKCAKDGEDCSAVGCCAAPGQQCYRQNQYWSQCRHTCEPGKARGTWDNPWSCEKVGIRTPAAVRKSPDLEA